MGKYPITQAQWQAVMGNNPSMFQGDKHPVEQVLWDEAIKFCEKLAELTGVKRYNIVMDIEIKRRFGESILDDLRKEARQNYEKSRSVLPNHERTPFTP